MKTNTFLRAVVAAVAVMVMAFSPVAAVTDGEVDWNNDYSFVGIMVAQDAAGNPLWRCSGTLIAPTLFLTAGHCTEAPAEHVEIWFDVDVESGITEDPYNPAGNGYPLLGDVGGTPYTHPSYNPNAFYLYDLGMVVLDEPVGSVYPSLPSLDMLDSMATQRGRQDTTFIAVGYGLQMSFPDAASWKENNARVRMVSTPRLIQINNGIVGDFSLLLSNNANTGGTCFGDSGGPNFVLVDGLLVIAGVTSFGMNGNCAGTGGVYRVDQADDLNWIATFFG